MSLRAKNQCHLKTGFHSPYRWEGGEGGFDSGQMRLSKAHLKTVRDLPVWTPEVTQLLSGRTGLRLLAPPPWGCTSVRSGMVPRVFWPRRLTARMIGSGAGGGGGREEGREGEAGMCIGLVGE